jgi:hypothetical protein
MSMLSVGLGVVVLIGCSVAWAEEAREEGEGLAAGFPGDVGIEAHPAVLFASGFENGFEGWSLVARDREISSVVEDPALAHTGTACCQSVAVRGVNTGGNVSHFFEGRDQVYLRFYCRFDKDAVIPHHVVKVRAIQPGVEISAGHRPPGDQAFWTGIEPVRDRTWQFYTYWHKMRPSRAGATEADSVYYGNRMVMGGQATIERERWICVEAMLKANTPGKSDGEQAFWIDGKLIGWWKPGSPMGNYRGTHFVTPAPPGTEPIPFEGFDFRSDPKVKINQVLLQWYVTEQYARAGTSDRNIVYFDDVVIATDYIGPMKPAEPAAGT